MARETSIARAPGTCQYVVVTRPSGSGKSQAIRALEDLGYFCVDDLPTTLRFRTTRATLPEG